MRAGAARRDYAHLNSVKTPLTDIASSLRQASITRLPTAGIRPQIRKETNPYCAVVSLMSLEDLPGFLLTNMASGAL